MKKVAIKVVKEVKVDNRVNNTGRPVNKKSARQIRLNKQAATKQAMDYVLNGGWFKLTPNCTGAYTFVNSNNRSDNDGHIATSFGGHECNIDNIGRTKITGYSFVMNKKINGECDVRNIIKIKRSVMKKEWWRLR
jgi:hypothetical protein